MTSASTPSNHTAPNGGSAAMAPARPKRRRGTVLLFALGVLAVISVAAVSYVTFVRVDRNSSSAAARTVGYDRQVNRMVGEIGTAIAADLWGNKVVTPDVPKDVNDREPSAKPLWPRMFEDGEYRDYPFTNFATLNRDMAPDESPLASAPWYLRIGPVNKPVEVAPQDDAWLAPIDPIWDTIGSTQSHWRQITNLRTMWRYDDSGTPSKYEDDKWVRGDGKFVDLGQVFTDPRNVGSDRRGNPGTNLLDPALGAILPSDAAGDYTRAPFTPMNFMSVGTPNAVFTPSDERFWADTDGDLRPDARWQLIDALGNAEGLMWVAATRIVDLSGMININSSIEGGYPANNVDSYVAGRTPADIDLYRFLLNDIPGENLIPAARRWNWTGSAYPEPSTDRLRGIGMSNGGTFSDHLIERLRLIDLTQIGVLEDPDPTTVGDFVLNSNWVWEEENFGGRLSADQRFEFWRSVGSAPGRSATLATPSGPVRPGYTSEVMIDLHSYAASNNRSILSEFEEVIDGPDSVVFPGYLPTPEDKAGDPIGPIASRVRPGDERYFSNAPNLEPSPATLAVRSDIRRLMTTVSGMSDVSPVPVLNFDALDWEGKRPYTTRYANKKIKLTDFSLNDVPAAYEAFVWALEPLATTRSLVGFNHLNNTIGGVAVNSVDDPAAHYGGPDESYLVCPVNSIDLTGGLASVEYGPSSAASFATITAASMAVNLADASDEDSIPTVARLLVASNPTPGRILDGKAYLGNRFSQGDIPAGSLPVVNVGNTVDETELFEQFAEKGPRAELDNWLNKYDKKSTGVTIVGAERTPYIGEVTVVGLFQTLIDPIIDVKDPNEQVGSMIAVQMINPWPEELRLDGYELVFLDPTISGGVRSLSDLNNFRFRFAPNSIVPQAVPGLPGVMTFHYIVYDSTGGKETAAGALRDTFGRGKDDLAQSLPPKSFEEALTNSTTGPTSGFRLVPADPETEALITANPGFVARLRNGGLGEKATVVLRRPASAPLVDPNTGLPALAVVDVLETDKAFFDYTTIDLADPALGFRNNLAYFQALGYDLTLPNPTAAFEYSNFVFGGRVALVSTMNRPVRASDGGTLTWFPFAAIQPLASETYVQNMAPEQYYAHAWLATAPSSLFTPPLPESDLRENNFAPGLPIGRVIPWDPVLGIIKHHELKGLASKSSDPSFASRSTGAGGWQLYIPDRDLKYLSELHQVCTFAHTCMNNEVDNLEAWATVGSQLRWAMSGAYDRSPTRNDNPYLGVLDPSRFMPDGSAFLDGGFPRDDSLAVPLAVRVFDCFDALDHADTLAQGRININTAPERVLQMLPSMAPGNSLYLNQNADRVDFLLRYRDAWTPGYDGLGDFVDYNQFKSGSLVGLGNTMNISNSDKIRRHDLDHTPGATGDNVHYRYTSGLATVGELTFLDLWGFDGELTGSTPGGFLTPIGNDGVDAGTTAAGRELLEGDIGLDPDGIVDDSEERLALFRAVSNIVSSRSDVFGAWFILRGYDPKTIEAIKVDDPNDPDSEMDDSENNFLPAYESRWFVIFDRSNCLTPTDRPRVLLKAQLPSSRP